MRIASDGKPFDVDHVPRNKTWDEVEVIQFLRPDGKRRRMLITVGGDLAELAKDMILSAEELQTGDVAVYARNKDEPEEAELIEIADNGPGENSPCECLKRLIRRKANQEVHQEDAKTNKESL